MPGATDTSAEPPPDPAAKFLKLANKRFSPPNNDVLLPAGHFTKPYTKHSALLAAAFNAVPAAQRQAVSRTALQEMDFAPGDVQLMCRLLREAGGLDKLQLVGRLGAKAGRGACLWRLLQECATTQEGAQGLRQWAGQLRAWHLYSAEYKKHVLTWPLCNVHTRAMTAGQLTAGRGEFTWNSYGTQVFHSYSVLPLRYRDWTGHLALLLCAVEPTCARFGEAAGLWLEDDTVQPPPLATAAAVATEAAAGSGGSGGGGGDDTWGLHTWNAGSEAAWSKDDLSEPVMTQYELSSPEEEIANNAVALRRVTGAQWAHVIGPLLRVDGRSEDGALQHHLEYEEDSYRTARAWESDDGGLDYNMWRGVADMRELDAALTAPECDDSHAGAALWGVAAALVHLHGEAALLALLRGASDTIASLQDVRSAVADSAPGGAGAKLAAVLWRLEGILGKDGMPAGLQ